MNARTRGIAALVAVLIALASRAQAQQQVSDEERLRKMVEYEQATAAPVQEHQRLAALAGKWNTEVKFWPGPGAAPIVLKGVCDNTMILGGRFLKSEGVGGGTTPIQSLQILGFDRRFGKYTYVDYDNFGTYHVTAAGVFDNAKNSMSLQGQEQQAPQGPKQKYDIVFHFMTPSKYVSEVIFKTETPGGGNSEFKVAEVTYTRSK